MIDSMVSWGSIDRLEGLRERLNRLEHVRKRREDIAALHKAILINMKAIENALNLMAIELKELKHVL